MTIRKVSPELFEKTKYLGKIASVRDVSRQTGLSPTTVTKIVKHCDDYRDYLDYLESSSENLSKRIRDAGLAQLSGEPLFWKVHSDLRSVSAKAISFHSGLDYGKVVRMKKAIDYQDFLKRERSKQMHKGRKAKVTNVVYYEVKRLVSEKQYPVKTIAEQFGLSLATVARIRKSSSLEDYKQSCASNFAKIEKKYGVKAKKTKQVRKTKKLVGLKKESELTNVSEAEPLSIQQVNVENEPKEEPKKDAEMPKLNENVDLSYIVDAYGMLGRKELENQRYKYRGIFILIGMGIVGLFGLGMLWILK